MSKIRKSYTVRFAGFISVLREVFDLLINKNSLNGKYVYLISENEPCGKVNGLYFSAKTGQIVALSIESLSLIPITKRVEISDIHKLTGEKIVLKKEPRSNDDININFDTILDKDVIGIKENGKRIKRIKDINFDFETGEISDFVIKRNPFGKKESIVIESAEIKKGVIYIK